MRHLEHSILAPSYRVTGPILQLQANVPNITGQGCIYSTAYYLWKRLLIILLIHCQERKIEWSVETSCWALVSAMLSLLSSNFPQ